MMSPYPTVVAVDDKVDWSICGSAMKLAWQVLSSESGTGVIPQELEGRKTVISALLSLRGRGLIIIESVYVYQTSIGDSCLQLELFRHRQLVPS